MRKHFVVLFSFLFSFLSLGGVAAPLGVTHLLPSPYTLPAGAFSYGSSLGYGLTSFLQVGTNLFQLLNDIPNANAKINIVDLEEWAAALTFDWSKFDLTSISGRTVGEVTSYGPGAVLSWGFYETLSWTNGIKLIKRNLTGTELGAEVSGLFEGTRFMSELAWLYDEGGEKKEERNPKALAFGISYDVTYEIFGFGLSHHWPGFQLGFHYYPSADDDKWFPIINGGGTVYF